jgi:hypothetical protein
VSLVSAAASSVGVLPFRNHGTAGLVAGLETCSFQPVIVIRRNVYCGGKQRKEQIIGTHHGVPLAVVVSSCGSDRRPSPPPPHGNRPNPTNLAGAPPPLERGAQQLYSACSGRSPWPPSCLPGACRYSRTLTAGDGISHRPGIQTQNISSSTYHIESFDACKEH